MCLMIPILSSFEKLNAGGVSNLALFDPELAPLAGSQAMDITLEGQEPVLLGAAKMTLIIPKGGLEEAYLRGSEPVWLLWPLE